MAKHEAKDCPEKQNDDLVSEVKDGTMCCAYTLGSQRALAAGVEHLRWRLGSGKACDIYQCPWCIVVDIIERA